MQDKKMILPFKLSILLFAFYILNGFWGNDALGNILSPLVGFFSFFMINRNYLDIKKHRSHMNHRIIWHFYALACISWVISDFVWAFYYFSSTLNPEESDLLVILYTFPNIFLGMAVIAFGYILLKKWNTLQLVIDVLAIALSIGILIWIVFFNKSIIMLDIITRDGMSSTLCISLSMLIMTGVIIWYISVRKGKIPIYITITAIGTLLFSLIDLYYYYVYYNEHYIPNTLVDIIYQFSFLLIALGAAWSYYTRYSDCEDIYVEVGNNVGFSKKQFLLITSPIIVVLYEGFVIRDLLIFLVIILVHEIIGIYVKAYIDNEQLLAKEKNLNLILEEKIEQRTSEVIEKNNELERMNNELAFLSNQDTVTSLYNRRHFLQQLSEAFDSIDSTETMALLFIDLDRFKMINDLYGHHIGDQVLVEIATRLKTFNNENSILARLGGDEFVLGFRGKIDYVHMEQIANNIINACGKAIEVEQYKFHITTSIGISIYPLDATDSTSLMRNADIAMYEAKALGKMRCVAFNSKFKDRLNRKSEIEFLLKKAVINNDFQVYFQPQFSIPDRKLTGAEALLRWKSDVMGWISPAEFIPIAEELDLINSIGEWVMERAIEQIAIWNHTYNTNLKVGINVSPKQLDYKTFIPHLKNIMQINSAPPEYIDIEITESIAMEDENSIEQIDSLFRGVGVSISIDDFGTGYSSLSYLKFFPFERIKIAKPLIDSIATDNYDLQIVKSVITLAKSIGMKTIAEGVELEDQFNILVDLGCDEIQGYYLGRPVPANQFEKLFITK